MPEVKNGVSDQKILQQGAIDCATSSLKDKQLTRDLREAARKGQLKNRLDFNAAMPQSFLIGRFHLILFLFALTI